MIIANIGSEKLCLDNQEDAEALLRILGRARGVDRGWGKIEGRMLSYYFPAACCDYGVEFSTSPLVSYQEHLAIQDAEIKEAA